MTGVTTSIEHPSAERPPADLAKLLERHRSAVNARPQHLLLTLLGDFWYRREEALPSAALVDLLAEFGVSTPNARAALSRLARRDLLVSSRRGRRTFYALTANAATVLVEGTHRIFTFGAQPRAWDGRWTVVAFSLPEQRRDTRHVLRTRLGWLGFASLYDAMWIAPGDRHVAAAALLADLDISTATIVVGPAYALPGDGPARAWDLAALRSRYEAFIDEFAAVRDLIHRGGVAPAVALVARTAIIDVWRAFPAMDPELPAEHLPEGWPRPDARALFAEVYDALGPLATIRFRQIVARHDEDVAGLALHHTVEEAMRESAEPATRPLTRRGASSPG
jgi:phenylacetic acid degradation operon negative regulatory protein